MPEKLAVAQGIFNSMLPADTVIDLVIGASVIEITLFALAKK